ncbi:MAG: PEP-CTERM sorting domain-containing protein, partial [Planctomycetia bacterium]|nr:PEP-CTERM sorting domain-containing protein [Planctomycetia bacterium]
PTGGVSFNFEFTAANTDPNWADAANSINDVLHLTGATPFTSSLTSANVINVFFDTSVQNGGEFFGGFFASISSAEMLSSIQNGTFNFFEVGSVPGQDQIVYNGMTYHRLVGGIVMVQTQNVASANFADGTVSGVTTSFVVVPEPSTAALAFIGVGSLLVLWRRRRAA